MSKLELKDVEVLQRSIAPGKPLRNKPGMDVRVGAHVPPRGGPDIIERVEGLLLVVQIPESDPWICHCSFENIHPFMDGNGRTGRLLWAWQMIHNGRKPFSLPFLHRFYYQTLESIEQSIFTQREVKAQ